MLWSTYKTVLILNCVGLLAVSAQQNIECSWVPAANVEHLKQLCRTHVLSTTIKLLTMFNKTLNGMNYITIYRKFKQLFWVVW